jgi:membrane protein YdbS with pleckstrin-like domain
VTAPQRPDRVAEWTAAVRLVACLLLALAVTVGCAVWWWNGGGWWSVVVLALAAIACAVLAGDHPRGYW